MQKAYLKDSFNQSLDFMVTDTKSFLSFALIFSLMMSASVFSFFSTPNSTVDVSPIMVIIGQLWGGIFALWLTVSLWQYLWNYSRDKRMSIGESFKQAIWDVPSYLIFALLYALLLGLSLLLFVFPIFIIGPMFYFLPYVAFMGLNDAGEGYMAATRRLTRGKFGALFLFFFLFLVQQFYLISLDAVASMEHLSLFSIFGYVAWVLTSIFLEAWAAFFLKMCHDDFVECQIL